VSSSINFLKNNYSTGPDNIPAPVIKHVKFAIASPLSYIFNLSCAKGIFPEKLKLARVLPLYKKGSIDDMLNYRPISLLNNFSKVFERTVYNKLINFLDKFNILYSKQFGFRKGHSTTYALFEAVNFIKSEINSKKHVLGLFLDLSKAFDTCNHEILLSKLDHYGIRGSMLEWFRSYLSNRFQYTEINNVKSNVLPINCGVPQGSVLGPLLDSGFQLC